MALENDGNGLNVSMPVQPMYGGGYGMPFGGMNGGFGNMFGGGDGLWFLLILLLCGGGWGGLGGFGMGGMWPMMMGMGGGFGLDYLYPWLNNSQHISDGFRDQQLNTTVQGIQNAVTSGFGDVQLGIAGVNQNISTTGAGIQQSMCQGFNSVNQNISGAAAQAEISANGRHNALTGQLYNNEIANLNRSFAEQTANQQGFNGVQAQLAQCCCDNRLGTESLRATVLQENCQDRYEAANNARDIIQNATGNTTALLNTIRDGIQSIKDDLCADRLEAERRENANLRSELMYARGQASQVEQTAAIRAGQATTANQLVNELRSCPIPAQPVYGNQPIFTCPSNNFGGCGCSAA